MENHESENVSRAFRKDFSFPSSPAPKLAEIIITVDDTHILYLNGERHDPSPLPDNYTFPSRYCLDLQPGKNVIAVEGHNKKGSLLLSRSHSRTTRLRDSIVTIPGKPVTRYLMDLSEWITHDSAWQSATVESGYSTRKGRKLTHPPPLRTPCLVILLPVKHKNTAAIIGGSIGGVAALLSAIAGLIWGGYLKYLLAVLLFALCGLFLFTRKRVVFVADEHLPRTQISLFLTHQHAITDAREDDHEKVLVWKTFNIGGAQRQIEVNLPSNYGSGAPKLGFGTVEEIDNDNGRTVKCTSFHGAPAELTADEIWSPHESSRNSHNYVADKRQSVVSSTTAKTSGPSPVDVLKNRQSVITHASENTAISSPRVERRPSVESHNSEVEVEGGGGTIEEVPNEKELAVPEIGKDKERVVKRRPHLVVRNSSRASRIAVGTIHEEDEKLNPFLLIEHARFASAETPEYEASSDLYLHIFRTNDYADGRFKSTLIKDVQGDQLSPDGGIRIKELHPLTTWFIKPAENGKLKLEIKGNKRRDVDKYRHECRVGKSARKKDVAVEEEIV